jgi:transcription elongation factor Elf1
LRKVKAQVKVITRGEGPPPVEVDFSCPVCGNEIILLVNPVTEEIIEVYADVGDEGNHQISCGICDSLLEWKIPKQIVNPSKRK